MGTPRDYNIFCKIKQKYKKTNKKLAVSPNAVISELDKIV